MNTPSRQQLRAIATALAVTLTLSLAAVAGCDSRQEPEFPSVQEKLRETQVHGQPKLRIGVAILDPLLDEEKNAFVNFEAEIARYVAASLGYEGDRRIDLVPLATEDRIPALQSGEVDLVVSSFSMTKERESQVLFAGPYFVTTQEVLIPIRLKDRVRTIEDLRDPKLRVCASGGSTSEAELEEHGIRPRVVKNVSDCVRGIREGRYDLVSSDEAILAGFRSQFPTEFQIVDMPFGTSERIGVGVPIGDPALRDLVAYFLDKSYQQGRRDGSSPWLTAYHKTLGPWLKADLPQPQPLNVPDLVDFDDKAPTR
ncbi:glutamate-binding protein [Micromonospora echinospora]|uniref:Amino acid ABC transporter substrate-binding protein, PAAT family n=1 Tax=Micromonospora echinospora TaxID=1877 RepID=A0A1C4WQX0_MICEC|nr:transporter substrate-binding domain-containing protein [Micromonospora echinospora]OZV79656.1 glutamate-binding protein [Micromonospora echinospora]SCE98635.1 amino acid ABC transporter substrate-binding protein, PAAT family [Micromonospora echinospora]